MYTYVTHISICILCMYTGIHLSNKYIIEGNWRTTRIQFHNAHHLYRESKESIISLSIPLYLDDDITHYVSEISDFSTLSNLLSRLINSQ